MKSQFQILSFLSQYAPKSALDDEFIRSFLVQRFQITPKTPVFGHRIDFPALDVYSFIQWLKNGLECLKIARFENRIILTGNPTLEECPVIASLTPDGRLDTNPYTIDPKQAKEATEGEIAALQDALGRNRLQPDPSTFSLVPQHIPAFGERVIFYDYALELQGVGVARDVDGEGNVTLFCYYTYPTLGNPSRIGYSMKEKPGWNLRSVVFESIDQDNKPTILGNSTSVFRRMNRELGTVGKIWKDKLQRIEPLNAELDRGSKYYYITDKLRVATGVHDDAPAPHLRYLAGNYFVKPTAAERMLEKINELVNEYLASPEWPEVAD